MGKLQDRAQQKFLGEIRGTMHELKEWSDQDLVNLRELSTKLAAASAAEIVKRDRRDRSAK